MKKLIASLAALAVSLTVFQTLQIPHLHINAVTDDDIIASQLDMPVICIDTGGQSVASKDTYVDAKIKIWDENQVLDMDTTDMSVRLRGNITLKLDKKSYKIKFPEKQNPLSVGDGKGKTWNLVANYYDTSMLRNMAAYHLGDLMDAMPYSANSRSVEVYVNGEYQGVYLLCEAVNVNKNRVAVTENPALVEDNGYLVQMTHYAEENVFSAGNSQYEIKSDLSEDPQIAQQQTEYISEYVRDALAALKSGNKEAAQQYIDTASLVDNFIANEICKNVDSGWDSYYIAKDADSKLIFEPMWDYDLALGNNNEAKGIDSYMGLNIFNVTDSGANSNPWLCYAMKSAWFREAVTERYNEMYDTIKTVPGFVTHEAAANARSYERNFTKWKTLGTSVYNEPEEIAALDTHMAHAQYLSTWIDNRIEWLDKYFDSGEFSDGVFLDENGKEINSDDLMSASSLMFYGGEGTVDTDSPGFEAPATSGGGWWAPQALAAGFMIQEGQKYKLSFEYSCTGSASVDYRIQQNHDTYAPYFRESVAASAEKQTAFKEFTASANDTNCALVMEFKGSGIVKIEHLSLVPVKPEIIQGDLNSDGSFTVSDIVLLQKWFLGAADIEDITPADYDKNGVLNIIDFCLMKKAILEL
ncbi:MAG: CotH kinase family protein [Oscillospiraceae bacterium]|nr:CotH kinase family protein [Oscillospiraceae bacterium]